MDAKHGNALFCHGVTAINKTKTISGDVQYNPVPTKYNKARAVKTINTENPSVLLKVKF